MQEKLVWTIKGRHVPVIIHYEYRRNSRVSIGKSAVLIRIPSYFNDIQRKEQLGWAMRWLENVLVTKPAALEHIIIEDLPDSYNLTIMGSPYRVLLSNNNMDRISARMKENEIEISLAESLSLYQRKQEVMNIISKLITKKFRPAFSERVAVVNLRTLKVSYDAVRLKNMRSRWGSCSSRGNLNFSTRLLLCPDYVIDYVIIHELAHRLEMNHSARFWGHVERAMSDYTRAENWLSVHGSKVEFV